MNTLSRLRHHEPDDQMPPVPTGWRVTHDFAFAVGGAERVSALLARQVAVDRPLVALGGRRDVFAPLGVDDVELRYPRILSHRHYRQASLLTPLVARFSRLIEGNVLASSYAFAHHLRATGHLVVYCHTPLRHVWSGVDMYTSRLRGPLRRLSQAAIGGLRLADRRAAHRAAAYVANSRVVAERIRRFYGIEPVAVAHPPHDANFHLRNVERGEHYVWAGRIVEPYKRLEPLLETFRSTPYRRLHVIGDGRDASRLRAIAPPNVTFLGELDTPSLAEAYAGARAVIFPSEDDFGLVPVEAMASGTPVVALARGGALETVVDEETGLLFPESTPTGMRMALDRFERETWDHVAISRYAEQNFGEAQFVRTMRTVLSTL